MQNRNLDEDVQLLEHHYKLEMKHYKIFETDYIRRNPPPSHNHVLIKIVMIIAIFAALILSGKTTVPTIQTSYRASFPMAVLGWILLDVMVVTSSWYFVKTHYQQRLNDDNLDFRIIKISIFVLTVFNGFTSIMTSIATIYESYSIITLTQGVGWVISVIVGTCLSIAPFITQTAAGTVLALLPLTFQIEMKSYEDRKAASWRRYKTSRKLYENLDSLSRSFMKPRENAVNIHEVREISHENHESLKPERTPDQQRIHTFLSEHESPETLTIADIKEELGLSTGLISEQRKIWKRENSI